MTTAGAPPSAEPVKAALKREPSADSSSSSSAAAPPASTRAPGTSGGIASNSKHTGRQVTRPQSANRSMRPLLLALRAVAPYGLAPGDGCLYPANYLTIADQLVAGGFTWRGYNEGIPAPCSMDHSSGNYARKHNPWVFFDSLRASGQCQANDVGLDQLP